MRGHNRLGVLVAGSRPARHSTRRAPGGRWLMALAGASTTPRARTARPADGADLAAALRRLLVAQRRRSQVVVISDFLGDDAWVQPLRPSRSGTRSSPCTSPIRASSSSRRSGCSRSSTPRPVGSATCRRSPSRCAPATRRPRPSGTATSLARSRRRCRVPPPVDRPATGSPTRWRFAPAARAAAVPPRSGAAHAPCPRTAVAPVGDPTMTFLSGWRLVLLLAPVALLVAYVLVQRRRHAQVLRFTSVDLLDSVAPQAVRVAAPRPGGALAARRSSCSTLAFAQPAMAMRTPKERATIMLTLDTSASMSATDVAPSGSRPWRSRRPTFVKNLPKGIQVGLVTFDGSARLLVPPSTDTAPVLDALELARRSVAGPPPPTASRRRCRRSPSVPKGTSDKPAPAVIVLMSDGSPTIGDGDADPVGRRRRGGRGGEERSRSRSTRSRSARRAACRPSRARRSRSRTTRTPWRASRRRAAARPSPPRPASQLGSIYDQIGRDVGSRAQAGADRGLRRRRPAGRPAGRGRRLCLDPAARLTIRSRRSAPPLGSASWSPMRSLGLEVFVVGARERLRWRGSRSTAAVSAAASDHVELVVESATLSDFHRRLAAGADPDAQRWLGWDDETMRQARAAARRRLPEAAPKSREALRVAEDVVTHHDVRRPGVRGFSGGLPLWEPLGSRAPGSRSPGVAGRAHRRAELARSWSRCATLRDGGDLRLWRARVLRLLGAGCDPANHPAIRALTRARFVPGNGPGRRQLADGRIVPATWFERSRDRI